MGLEDPALLDLASGMVKGMAKGGGVPKAADLMTKGLSQIAPSAPPASDGVDDDSDDEEAPPNQ